MQPEAHTGGGRMAVEAQVESVLQSVPEAICSVDGAGRIVFVNAPAERLFGYSRDELIGRTIELVLPGWADIPTGPYRFPNNCESHLRQTTGHLELCGVRRDGSAFPAEVSFSATPSVGGLMVTGIVRDISCRKRVELERARLIARERAAH